MVVHTDGSPAGLSPAGGPERPWLAVDSVPWGVPIQVRDAGGNSAIAIRHAAMPEWFNEGRSASIDFTPTEWAPLEG